MLKSLNFSRLNKLISNKKQMLIKNNNFTFAKKTNSNYKIYLDSIKNLKNDKINKMANIVENEINLSHNLKNDMRLKDMHIDKVATNKLSKNNITNNIKITPYFEETVNKKELDPTVMTFKENILKIKGPATPKKQLNRQQLKFMKKFKVIRERIKRHMHDDNLYRNDTTAKELEGHHPLLKRALSIDNASIGEFRQARMLEIRKL